MASRLWTTRPDLRPWCARLTERAATWRPDPSLDVDASRIVAAIEQAAADTAPWLAHPCMNRLTLHETDNHFDRDVRFVTWIAAHTGAALGTMTIERATWRWSRAGTAVETPAGRHDVNQLVASDNPARDRHIAIDPYCVATGFPLDRSWRAPFTPAESSLLAATVRETRYALDTLERLLPDCAHWAAALVHVVVPLRAESTGSWSSGSQPEIPGLIQLTGLTGPALALEGLVHEAAHHHFTMLEASGPFVDPLHGDLYSSPLRAEPRPLRNVLLAVHALRHMVDFYKDALESGLLSPEWASRQSHLTSRLESGLASLMTGRPHYTVRGEALLAVISQE